MKIGKAGRGLAMVAALAGVVSIASAGDMTEILRSGEIWKKERQELAEDVLQGVQTRAIDEHSVRVPRDGGLTLEGLEFGEVILNWNDDDRLTRIDIMIYNKGDDGEISKEEYDKLEETSADVLTSLAGGAKGKGGKSSAKKTGVEVSMWSWRWEGGVARLECSSTGKKKGFAPEFIRLKLGSDKEALEQGGARDAVRRHDLKSHVKKEGTAVWIEGVNMVDQGQKGYCVPATLARVFAYYGMDGVDQHALAQLCNSSGDDGTSFLAMQQALAEISRPFHFKVVYIDSPSLVADIVASYNKTAKKMRKKQVDVITLSAMDFDGDVLLAARAGKPAQVKKWLEPIRKSIDAGQPVLWSVQLGIYPEQEANQNRGGHMRLIIGYDLDENAIYYSDSWGAGHERKKMPAGQACAMTTGRYILKK